MSGRFRWSSACVIALCVTVVGCSGELDAEDVIGTYGGTDGAARVKISADGTFRAASVPSDSFDEALEGRRVDFFGRWEYLDNSSSNDVIYLSIDKGEASEWSGLQLYVKSADHLYFQADPDAGPSLEFDRIEP